MPRNLQNYILNDGYFIENIKLIFKTWKDGCEWFFYFYFLLYI